MIVESLLNAIYTVLNAVFSVINIPGMPDGMPDQVVGFVSDTLG